MTTNIDWFSAESTIRKQLLALEKSKLVKICKSLHVPQHGNKNTIIDRLIDKNKQNKLSNKPHANKRKKKSSKTKKKSSKTMVKHIDAKSKSIDNEEEKALELLSPLLSPPVPLCLTIDDTDETEDTQLEMKRPNKSLHIKVDSVNYKKKRGSYIWILDKNRKLRSIPSPIPVQSVHRRVISLTNSHNFLWITSVLRGTLHAAQVESEITKSSMDKLLSLLPKRYRLKIWEIINVDNDSFIVCEDYLDFVDALLIATGQKDDLDDDEDIDLEIRDMRPVFNKIVNADAIFKVEKYITKAVSKSRSALSVEGAQRIILDLRNMKEADGKKDINIVNDLALPILTGLTKKALMHGVAYCTRNYWKILTDVFWDEEDEEDLALCTPIGHFTKVAHTVNIGDLFGDLYCEMSYDLAEIQENVMQTVEDNEIEIDSLDV